MKCNNRVEDSGKITETNVFALRHINQVKKKNKKTEESIGRVQ